MIESAIERLFVRLVREAGGIAWKLAPTTAGIPDRLVLMPGGLVLFVELKTETGALSAIQRHRHAEMAALDIPVAVLYGRQQVVDWCTQLKEGNHS